MKKKIQIIYNILNKNIKNEYELNIIKNFISFYSEKNEMHLIGVIEKIMLFKKKYIYKTKLDNAECNNNYINLDKFNHYIYIYNNNLVKTYNIKNIKIALKKHSNIGKNLENTYIYNNLNIHYITNKILNNNLINITITKNITFENPIYIINVYENTNKNIINNNCIFLLDNSSKTTIIDLHINVSKNLTLNTITNFNLKNKSNLTYYLLTSNNATHTSSIFSKQSTKSNLNFKEVALKSQDYITYHNFFLLGENSKINKNIAHSLMNSSKIIIFNNIFHYKKNTDSNLLLKCITHDKSKLSFQGNINVGLNIEAIKSKLTCNGLILSDYSEMEFIPELSINNNNVICSHAATIGNINETIITYMMSRGLKLSECKKIIEDVFLNTISNDEVIKNTLINIKNI